MQKQFFSLTVAAALLLSTLFFSCQKELSNETGGSLPPATVGTPILPATPVTGTVSGIVTDENDDPVPNASVLVAGTTYTTDAKGFFNTANHSLDKYISTVEVNMPGYFKALRSFCANPSRNYVAIKLIPKTLAGSFASGSSGNISLPNGSQIGFTAGSIVDKATGAPFTGNVKVFSAYVDPTASDISARVPGSFIGQDNTNMYALASAGMIAVELESDGGVPLQLATGKSAVVKLLIPASLQGSAPASMDTWSLDARGVWKKEASATKNGNYYEFAANHFSFWNCDIPNSSIYLNLYVTDQNNQPLGNTYVDIKPTVGNLWSHAGGLTDSTGHATAFVPANQVLQLSVFVNRLCFSPAYTQNIGPYTANTNVNIVATVAASIPSVLVQGTAVNCSGAPVQSGTAVIYTGQNVYHAAIVNGSFSKTIYVCSPITSVDIIVGDHATLQQSTTANVAVTANTANAGSLSACGISTSQYINYTVDGTNYVISSVNPATYFFASSFPGAGTFILGDEQASGTTSGITFSTPGTAVGTFGINADSLSINTFYGAQREPSASVTFTAFGPTGQFLEGNFNIPFTHSSTGATVHTCTGNFRVKRN
jgi:hypothetical protein